MTDHLTRGKHTTVLYTQCFEFVRWHASEVSDLSAFKDVVLPHLLEGKAVASDVAHLVTFIVFLCLCTPRPFPHPPLPPSSVGMWNFSPARHHITQ